MKNARPVSDEASAPGTGAAIVAPSMPRVQHRTQADRRRAVRAALADPEWSKRSNREIARHCCVDHKTVGAVRRSEGSGADAGTLTGEGPAGGESPTWRPKADPTPASAAALADATAPAKRSAAAASRRHAKQSRARRPAPRNDVALVAVASDAAAPPALRGIGQHGGVLALGGRALTMTSREIANLTCKRHDNVMADIRGMLVELHGEGGLLSFQDTHVNEQNGQRYPIFCLPKRETLILVSGYSVPMRAKIIDRLEELEEQAVPSAALPNFADPAAAARAWADAHEARSILAIENERQAEQIAAAAPKVAFADAIANSEDSLLLRDAAKLIGVPEQALRAKLKEKGVLLRDNAPAAEYVKGGHLKPVAHTYETPKGTTGHSTTTRVTGLGIEFMRRFARKHGLIVASEEVGQGVLA